ncbi:MAG TPA: plastocyanin/azurin family copper-binding protein, partial [Planctomycetota bacterium]|nr:plastocyanin/azurin family copper-binding protein [Planctomycetota bacterium]
TAARAIDGNASPRFEDRGQTHTIEGRPEPWWELDLGHELPIEAIVVHNRGEEDGRFAARLDDARVTVLDAERRSVFEAALGRAPIDAARLEVSAPALLVRARAARALAALAVPADCVDEAAARLVARFDDAELRPHVGAALRDLPPALWPQSARAELGDGLTLLFEAAHGTPFDRPDQRELLAFADEVAEGLPADDARSLRLARRPLGPQVIVLRSVPDSLQYDRARFRVVAGRPVELVFDNVDIMPHNLVVTAPGALAQVGRAADRIAADPDAASRDYVPDLPEVLHATRQLRPGQSQRLEFVAPSPADYPYVCTFPGHWLRMNGVMEVVASYDELEAPEATPVASSAPTRAFVRQWSFDDLTGSLAGIAQRDPAPGRAVLEAASCLRCHALAGAGGGTGPAFEEIAARRTTAELLAHVLEPSLEIDEAYRTEMFFMLDGTLRAGRVVREDARSAWLQVDPYSEAEPVEVSLDEVEERVVSQLSTMPAGLLSTFRSDEILDLLAHLRSLAPERKSP